MKSIHGHVIGTKWPKTRMSSKHHPHHFHRLVLPLASSAVIRSRCLTYQSYFSPYLCQNEIMLCNWISNHKAKPDCSVKTLLALL
ncbi:unnamed protein product [Larinioides sclopetarius]|uniref:Uncharacterized protein n=1 Tax=Larinioides sclopetarius TaxID=280406 RepID=A0AAV2BBM8_9ARAC